MLFVMPPTNATIAAAVRAELARAGMSRREAARQLGVDSSYLDRRLSPELTSPPSFPIERLHQIAQLVGVPLARLLGDEPQPTAAAG